MQELPIRVFQDLAASSLFNKIPLPELRALIGETQARFTLHERNSLLAYRGDPYETLLMLTRGILTAEIVDERGVSLKVETLTGPTPVATAVLFASRPELPVQLRAESAVEILTLSRQNVLDLCRRHEQFLINYLKDGGDKVTFLAEKIRLLRFTTIRQKIAVYFLDLARRQAGNQISLPYSLEVVAEIFGVTRPALSRCLSQLVEEKILERQGRDYRISSRTALKALLEE